MNAPPVKRKPRHANAAGLEMGSLGRRADRKHSAPRPTEVVESWTVVLIRDDGRRVEWGRANHELAERIARRLRDLGMHADVERVDAAEVEHASR